MYNHVLEQETVGRFTVKVFVDDDVSLADAVNDEPVMMFTYHRRDTHEILDQSKRAFPSLDFLRAYEDSDIAECLTLLCDYYTGSEWEWINGRVRLDFTTWSRARYFKSEESALAAVFFAEYAMPLSDLRVEKISTQDAGYFLVFWQTELDAYAGCKDAISCRESCRSVLDGEVYYFIIMDSDGDYVDSCGGFIGALDYCMESARETATWLESDASEKDACALARTIQESRPGMTAA